MGDYIAQFVKEVVQKDVTGLLPQNLSDKWLEILSAEAEEVINVQNGLPANEQIIMSALLISVLTILEHQQGKRGEVEIAPEELIRCFQNYTVALVAEEISRKTDIKVEPPNWRISSVMTGRSKSITQGLLNNEHKEGEMTKSGLIDAIHGKSSSFTKVQVAHVVDTMIDSIKSALAKGERVEIRGFGNFQARKREGRKARNPRTGEIFEVPSKKVPHFKPGKELKEMVGDVTKST
jgi:integration host factor subunit beta